MSDALVEISQNDGIVDIRLNRPAKHNSLTLDMFEAIASAGEQLHDMKDARVAILSGNGPSFCAGLDLSVMQVLGADNQDAVKGSERLLAREGRPDNLAQRVGYVWHTAPVPVIAALHGVTFGGGFQIAMACDIRVAAPTTRLCIMESRYGLIPDMSITQTIPALIARDQALELTLTGREFDGGEAMNLGLVTQLADDPYAAAQTLAQSIAARSPDAVRSVKQLYNETWGKDAALTLALETDLQLGLIGGTNQIEAVSAAMEKREPKFRSAGD